jgi:hypothetical protein
MSSSTAASKYDRFKKTITENSVSSTDFAEAIKEWTFHKLLKSSGSVCICGQAIIYNYIILNTLNSIKLTVGSVCINKVEKEYASQSQPVPAVVQTIKSVDKVLNSLKKKTIIFGKYEPTGLTFEELIEKDKDYSRWMVENVKSPVVRKNSKLTAKQKNMCQYKQFVRAHKIQ